MGEIRSFWAGSFAVKLTLPLRISVTKIVMNPICTRWVEETHAEMHHIQEVPHVGPAGAIARLRGEEHIPRLLHDPVGHAFVAGLWHGRMLIPNHFADLGARPGMTVPQSYQHIYGFGYGDMSICRFLKENRPARRSMISIQKAPPRPPTP